MVFGGAVWWQKILSVRLAWIGFWCEMVFGRYVCWVVRLCVMPNRLFIPVIIIRLLQMCVWGVERF
jgi:hypothetical protein